MNLIYFHLTEWSDEMGRKKLDAQLAARARLADGVEDDPDAPPWWWDDSGNEGAMAAFSGMGVVRR